MTIDDTTTAESTTAEPTITEPTFTGRSTLYLLSDRGQMIDGLVNDVRGREVKDTNGTGIGTIADLLIDERQKKVRFMLVEHGGFLGFGETKSLIPVEAITKITEHHVLIDQSGERVTAAPAYDPKLIDDGLHHAGVYQHYGYAPYWGVGYRPNMDGGRHL